MIRTVYEVSVLYRVSVSDKMFQCFEHFCGTHVLTFHTNDELVQIEDKNKRASQTNILNESPWDILRVFSSWCNMFTI